MPLVTRLLMIFCLLLVAGATVAQNLRDELSDCVLKAPGSTASAKARCGSLQVPLNYAQPEGEQIELFFAVVPARQGKSQTAPLFLFAGGPGQAASEAFVAYLSGLDVLFAERDIVLLDQRGTGRSAPLDCPVGDLQSLLLSDETDVREYARQCRDSLPYDPRFFTSFVAARDVDRLRGELGYEQINLYGGSYGTRAALTYLREFEANVRAVVLDGVAPNQLALGFDHAQNLDATLELISTRCQTDPDCSAHFEDFRDQVRRLMQRLDQSEESVTVAHPTTGELLELPYDPILAAGAIRLLAYAPETVALLPLLIDFAVEEGEMRYLFAQALLAADSLQEQISRGMELAVICTEDAPYFADASRDQGTVLGSEFVDLLRDQCDYFPRGIAPDDLKKPVESDVPVLLLSGEYDPVTPPRYAELAAETLSNSRHLIAAGQGHIVLVRGCTARLVDQFLDTPVLDELDPACLEELRPTPFFTSLTGPTP